jgi:flagellar hook-basal body complex protein FliE
MDSINNISNGLFAAPGVGQKQKFGDGSFQDVLKSIVSNADNRIKEANQGAEEFAVGKRHNLHEIMIATEKADLSFRFLLQIRNKLLDAYQEIMRMTF